MNARLRAYFDLVRLPNVITAPADILAGFLYAGGRLECWRSAVLLGCASACLYGGGVTLNDLCDVGRDAEERPDRPIPSGRVSRRNAWRLAVALMTIGVALAGAHSLRAAGVACLLVVSIVLYDAVLKSTALASPLMGLCRALNLGLGMTGAATTFSKGLLAPLALLLLYVTFLTLFARREAARSNQRHLQAATAGVVLSVLGVMGLVVHDGRVGFLAVVSLLAVTLGSTGLRAARSADPRQVQAAVRMFVLSIVLFDACIVWAARGPWPAVAVAALLLPAVGLGRMFRVT